MSIISYNELRKQSPKFAREMVKRILDTDVLEDIYLINKAFLYQNLRNAYYHHGILIYLKLFNNPMLKSTSQYLYTKCP